MEGNPVLYFNSMCPGPWRMDVDDQVLALHLIQQWKIEKLDFLSAKFAF